MKRAEEIGSSKSRGWSAGQQSGGVENNDWNRLLGPGSRPS